MNKDKLLTLLALGGTLLLDNDCCYVVFENGPVESESFDFTPTELVEILTRKLGFKLELV